MTDRSSGNFVIWRQETIFINAPFSRAPRSKKSGVVFGLSKKLNFKLKFGRHSSVVNSFFSNDICDICQEKTI